MKSPLLIASAFGSLLLLLTDHSLLAKPKSAETPKPTKTEEKESEKEEGIAYLRVWRIGEPGPLTAALKKSGEDSREIYAGEDATSFESYSEIPPITARLEVTGPDDQIYLKRPVDLHAGTFTTLLLRRGADDCTAEVMDDTLVQGAGAAVTIYPVGVIANPRIEIGEQAVLKLKKLDRRLRVEGLNPEKTFIKVQSGADTEKPGTSVIELNLNSIRHISVILGFDRYGRARPRVFVDGQLEAKP